MRKILLATTALVGVAFCTAGVAQAAAPTSPITVNVGGYVDAIAGFDHESQASLAALPSAFTTDGEGSTAGVHGISHDFETEFKLNIDAIGKASNGVQYGANIGLWNGPEVTNLWTGGSNSVELNSAYVWLSGAFGKVLFGDEHGASDLFVYAPTVGEGQVDGRYTEFTSPFVVAHFYPSGIDNTEHSTKITYYTPKVGNDTNKVQLGFSYAPQMYNYGQDVVLTNLVNAPIYNGVSSPYQDLLKGAIQYTGDFHPVNVTVSAQIINGSSQSTAPAGTNPFVFAFAPAGTDHGQFQSFTAWGLGTQVGFEGFTLGGSFADNGSYGAVGGQDHDQHTWTFGGKYEIDKVSVGASLLNGKGYDNLLAGGGGNGVTATSPNFNYVDNFNAYSVGATYTWFPGLTSAVDGTMFQQSVRDQAGHDDGYALLVSQKLTF